MAPSKRTAKTASSPPAKRGRAAKAAVVSTEPQLALLEELRGGLTEDSLEMLMAAIPHVLATPAEERHKFQLQVVHSLKDITDKEREKRRQSLAEAVAAKANHEVEVVNSDDQTTALKAKEEEADAKKKAAEDELARATKLYEEAAKVSEDTAAAVPEAEKEVEACKVKLEDHKAMLGNLWKAVKAGFPKKDWRLREKAIKQVIQTLTTAEAPASLLAALPHALKEAEADRSAFAHQCTAEAERLLEEQTQTLITAVEARSAKVSEAQQEAEAAAAKAKEATVVRDDALEKSISAENEWLAAEEARRAMAKFIANSDSIAQTLEATRKEHEDSLLDLEKAEKEWLQMLEPRKEAAVVETPAETPADSETMAIATATDAMDMAEGAPATVASA